MTDIASLALPGESGAVLIRVDTEVFWIPGFEGGGVIWLKKDAAQAGDSFHSIRDWLMKYKNTLKILYMAGWKTNIWGI